MYELLIYKKGEYRWKDFSPIEEISLGNGETLGYRERDGGTEKLLLIHGNMTSSKHWDILIEKMTQSIKYMRLI